MERYIFENRLVLKNFVVFLLTLLLSIILSITETDQQVHYHVDNSPLFGVTYHTELRYNFQNDSFDQEAIAEDLRAIKSLDVNIIRTDVSWQRVPISEEKALSFDIWLIEQIHSLEMKILFVIKTPEQINLYSPILTKADYWQIGNEPNSLAFAQAAGNRNYEDTIDYLVKNINLIQSSSSPITTVLNPVDVPEIYGAFNASWLDIYNDLKKKGVRTSIIGIDSYPGGPYQWGYPSEVGRSIHITRQSLDVERLESLPIWIIETGSPTYRRSLESQSRYIREIMASFVSAKGEGLIIYEAFDNSKASSELTEYLDATTAIEANFGLFYEDRTPKPAAKEYKILIHQVREKRPIKRPFVGIIYDVLVSIMRLIMPTGGPVSLTELVVNPNFTYSVIGLAFRYSLGSMLSNIKKYTGKKNILKDFYYSLAALSPFIVFQLVTNTFVLIWYLWLNYLIIFLLYLWCGIVQIRVISDFPNGINFKYRIEKYLSAIIGFLIALFLRLPAFGWFLIILVETIAIIEIRSFQQALAMKR